VEVAMVLSELPITCSLGGAEKKSNGQGILKITILTYLLT